MTDQNEYSLLVLPIHGKQVKDIVGEFKQLNRHPEFTSYPKELYRDKLVACINYLYSSKSPIIKTYTDDLLTRKEQAAIMGGFDPKNKDEWTFVNEYLFMFKSHPEYEDAILSMVIRFLIMQNNMIWTNICSTEQQYYQNVFHIARVLDSSEKDKDIINAQEKKNSLRKQNMEITNDLEALYEKLFTKAEDVRDHYKKKEEVRFNFTSPETVSRMPLQERPETKQSF